MSTGRCSVSKDSPRRSSAAAVRAPMGPIAGVNFSQDVLRGHYRTREAFDEDRKRCGTRPRLPRYDKPCRKRRSGPSGRRPVPPGGLVQPGVGHENSRSRQRSVEQMSNLSVELEGAALRSNNEVPRARTEISARLALPSDPPMPARSGRRHDYVSSSSYSNRSKSAWRSRPDRSWQVRPTNAPVNMPPGRVSSEMMVASSGSPAWCHVVQSVDQLN